MIWGLRFGWWLSRWGGGGGEQGPGVLRNTRRVGCRNLCLDSRPPNAFPFVGHLFCFFVYQPENRSMNRTDMGC